ncbi:MAG: hypothetical protein D6681_19605, partial [Calditrichaeota bacterium]
PSLERSADLYPDLPEIKITFYFGLTLVFVPAYRYLVPMIGLKPQQYLHGFIWIHLPLLWRNAYAR